jgi:hypothetical protein
MPRKDLTVVKTLFANPDQIPFRRSSHFGFICLTFLIAEPGPAVNFEYC